jgi:hypothetical protein
MSSTSQPSGTGGEAVPGGPGADTGAVDGTLTGFEARLLAELQVVVAERAAAAGPADQAAAAGREAGRRAGRGTARRPRRLAVTGALSAALAAGLAVTLALTSTSEGTRPPAGHFEAATTVAAVLNNAAVAALREPAVTPRPGQFVYAERRMAFYQPRHHGIPADRTTQTLESWTSVGGTRVGATLTTGPTTNATRTQVSACVHGHVQPALSPGQPCTPRGYAGYRPWLPTTTAGMRAYLGKAPRDGSRAQSDIEEAYYLLTSLDLTPAQQAAMYHALAQTPGLTIVPKVTDILGRTGIGIRSRPARRFTWTAIFDPTTFKLLGSDIEPVGRAYDRSAVVVEAAIVNKVGQRP